MLSSYIEAAMRRAVYERLDEDGSYIGRIPELAGVWAQAETATACHTELQEVLEEWLMVSLAKGLPIPPIDGIELAVKDVA